jgi:hypothetical protein
MSDCCAFYRGRVYFTPVDGVRRHVGNVSELVLTPVRDTMDLLDAFAEDCCQILACTLEMTFNCMTPENMSIALGSEMTQTQEGTTTTFVHSVGKNCNGYGAVEFDGYNAFGGTIKVLIPSVRIYTSDRFNVISRQDIESLTLTGRVMPTVDGWFTVTTTHEDVCG